MDIYGNKLVNTIETKPLCASLSDLSNQFLCRLRSIAAHRDHFVRHLSVCACVCLSDSHTFLIATHSYVSQATHAFLGMLPLCLVTIDVHRFSGATLVFTGFDVGQPGAPPSKNFFFRSESYSSKPNA